MCDDLWLLHDLDKWKPIGLTIALLGLFPTSFLAKVILRDSSHQYSFFVAMLRLLKVAKFRENIALIRHFIMSDSEKTHSYLNSLVVWYALLIATHIIGCGWLILGRIDPDRNNWFVMDNFD